MVLKAVAGSGALTGVNTLPGVIGVTEGAGYVDPGMPWLNDTVPNLDIAGFLNKRPTIFYDPSASTSLNRGTKANPYNSVTTLQARVAGNMAGQVLGIKRGTISASLAFTCYGTSSQPFSIVPYGDANALPILSGETLRNTWTSVQTTPQQIWKTTVASKGDLYENAGGDYQRLFAITAANEAAMITAIATFAGAPKAGTYGCSGYVGTTAYIYLIDGTNPNAANNVYSADSQFALSVTVTDLAGTGYINISGIHCRMTYDSALAIKSAVVSSTNAPAGFNIVGNWQDHVGSQELQRLGGVGIAADGIVTNFPTTGNSNSGAPATAGYIAANYANDILNNAIEINACTGWLIEHNLGRNTGGNSIIELFQLNLNHTIRWNRGYSDLLSQQRFSNAFHQSSIWCNNFDGAGVAANAKNGGHKIFGNYGQDATVRFLDHVGGQNDIIFNNTWAQINNTGAYQFSVFQGGATATGTSYFNNLHYHNTPYQFPVVNRINPSSDSTPIPTMNYNAYDIVTGAFTNYAFELSGTQYYNLATWRTATSQEANSLLYNATGNNAGVASTVLYTQTAAPYPVLGTNTDYVIANTSPLYQTASSVAAYPFPTDDLGRPVTAATPNFGSYQGSGN